MTTTYEIDSTQQLVRARWVGAIDAQALKAHWKEIVRDPGAENCRGSLGDLREAELCFTGAEMAALVRSILVQFLEGRSWKSAVLVERQVQFGVARQWDAFTGARVDVAIFDDEGKALDWLAS